MSGRRRSGSASSAGADGRDATAAAASIFKSASAVGTGCDRLASADPGADSAAGIDDAGEARDFAHHPADDGGTVAGPADHDHGLVTPHRGLQRPREAPDEAALLVESGKQDAAG